MTDRAVARRNNGNGRDGDDDGAGDAQARMREYLIEAQRKLERARRGFVDVLLDHVREDRFPSSTMMDTLEAVLRPDEMAEYIDALVEKLGEVRYPSPDMQKRIAALVAR